MNLVDPLAVLNLILIQFKVMVLFILNLTSFLYTVNLEHEIYIASLLKEEEDIYGSSD